MSGFRLYRGEELTIEQCRALVSHPKNRDSEDCPSPEELFAKLKKHSNVQTFFIFYDNSSLVAHAMAGKYDYEGTIMTIDDFWSSDFALNLKFYRSTQRTPGYEIFLKCLDWGVKAGFDKVSQPLVVGMQGKRAWEKLISSGLLTPVSANMRFQCGITKTLPELLDLS